MSEDANSVNIARYHHGDLRAAALEAGLRRLTDGGAEQLSLRDLAREIGVSAPALYRHFPSKAALLDALARRGFDRLGERQRAASDAAGGGSAGFAACGRAYVAFALDQPALFRLMSARMPIGDPFQAPLEAVPDAIRFLRETVDRLLPAAAPAEHRRATALHAWALVHGLALLMLDGPIAPDPALIDAVIAQAAVGASATA